MTTKRFEYILGEFWDNVSDEPLSCSEIEKKINALNDENEQLKKQLNAFKPIIFEDVNNGGSSILYEKVEE